MKITVAGTGFVGKLLEVYSGNIIEKCFYQIRLFLKFYSVVAHKNLLWKVKLKILYIIHGKIFKKIKNKYINPIKII